MVNYADRGFVSVTESAANTLTFQELVVASVQDIKHKMIIHRIEYALQDSMYAE